MRLCRGFGVFGWEVLLSLSTREFDVRIGLAESFYGSRAMAKAFWKCLQYCDKCFGKLFGVCGYSRKSLGVCLGVRGYSRKSLGVCLGVCGYSRKSLGVCLGVCGSPASLAANALAFAGVPRGISKDTLAVTTLYQRHSPGIKIPHSFVELTLSTFFFRLGYKRKSAPRRSLIV